MTVQCAWCKKVKTLAGIWVRAEYISQASHGICPNCGENLKRSISRGRIGVTTH